MKITTITTISMLYMTPCLTHCNELNLSNYDFIKSSYYSNLSVGFKGNVAHSYIGKEVDEGHFPNEYNVIDAQMSFGAFAYLKKDGSVVTKGDANFGGDSSGVKDLLSSGVKKLTNTAYDFSALKENGDVIYWGRNSAREPYLSEGVIANNIETMYAARNIYYAGIDINGKIKAWGIGDKRDEVFFEDIENDIQGEVSKVITNAYAISILTKPAGKVVSWGKKQSGGNQREPINVINELQSDIIDVVSTYSAFAALNINGDVFTWGGERAGATLEQFHDIRKIVGNRYAFAAIKNDGTVISWGDEGYGGVISEEDKKILKDVISIHTTPDSDSFAALTKKGKVILWGKGKNKFNTISRQVSDNVVNLYVTKNENYIATKNDGSQVIW